ncbi:MAG: AmmeMemoRadiSam system protein B [Spirochaetota bacterium]
MAIRRLSFAGSWYPAEPAGVRDQIEAWALTEGPRDSLAIVAPHAGWKFSGKLAALAWTRLKEADTIVIIGGHLGPLASFIFAPEESLATPQGEIQVDRELRDLCLRTLAESGFRMMAERESDNTVELQLPFAAFHAPLSRCICLRAPEGKASIELGLVLAQSAASIGRSLAVVASSDLTHYGPDYGFEPKGRGTTGLGWMKDTNDRRFIESVLALDAGAALSLCQAERSACSGGAVAAAISFAKAMAASGTELLGYGTSYDLRPADSFVGYAAMAIGMAEGTS